MSDQCWQASADVTANYTGDGVDAACAGVRYLADTALSCVAVACYCVSGTAYLPTDAESPCLRLEPF